MSDKINNSKYEHFDVKFKLNCVEEFLKLKEDPSNKIGYGVYAKSKGVGKTTFISWVNKYLKDKDKYFKLPNINNEVILSNNVINNKPQFIKLSESNIKQALQPALDNKVDISVDGLSLSFNIDNLERVLEVLRK